MSKPISRDDALFRQRFLSCCGLYKVAIDGDWGPRTDAAEARFFEDTARIAEREGRFDPRSEAQIATLRLDAQSAARRSLSAIRAALGPDLEARIISATRSYAEQDRLFRQGRFGNPGPRVTNARGGGSWHNFGLAWDIGLFERGRYIADDVAPYRRAGPAGRIAGVEWGGDWKSFPDAPHYQFSTAGRTIAAARTAFEAGCRG